MKRFPMNKNYIFIGIAGICLILLAIIFHCVYFIWSYSPNSIIPNKLLEKAVREQIGKPIGKITPDDCLGVVELKLTFWNFSFKSMPIDLEGLQYFIDLEVLYCKTGSVSDISALSNLRKLRELDLEFNKISDLTPLSELKNLEVLKLYNNRIRDLTPLASLTNLKELVIGKNPVGLYADGFIPLKNLFGLEISSYAEYSIIVGQDELIPPNAVYGNR